MARRIWVSQPREEAAAEERAKPPDPDGKETQEREADSGERKT